MIRPIATAAKLYTRFVIKRRPRDRDDLVRHLRRTMDHVPLPVLLPRGVSVLRTTLGPRECDVVSVERPTEAVLYLHGGGYVAGVPRTYHAIAGRLAKGLGAEVFVPTYRLAPEHPFPAAHEDAIAVYEALLAKGHTPDTITLGGDSAGAGLALSLLLALRDRGLPLPRCAFLLSPYADVSAASPSVDANDRSDAMLSAYLLRLGGNIYRGDADPCDPYVSPVHGDFRGFPPLLVAVEERECLFDDAFTVVARAREAGVPVELLRRDGLFHVWPVFVPYLPEAREDVERIVDFVRRVRDGARGA